MPVTPKQIDAVLKDKSVSFHRLYAPESQRWFVDFVLDTDLSNGVNEADATKNCKELAQKVRALFSTLDAWKLKDPIKTEKPTHLQVWDRRLVEIVYGVAAQEPKILTERGYLDFIVRRRLRTVVRMQGYVNDNAKSGFRGYVTYPGECRQSEIRVCDDAKALWTHPTPFRVDAATTPEIAIAALYSTAHPNTTPTTSSCTFGTTGGDHIDLCKSNKFDCSHAVISISLDALLEAADPGVFLSAVQASVSDPGYVSIRFPAPPGTPHVFWRPNGSKQVFERTQIPAPQFDPASGDAKTPARLDLQNGDHVYIRNLPLFVAVSPDPEDVWQGEHSIVVQCGSRTFKDGMGFLFSGHGLVEVTLIYMMRDFNDKLNTALSRAAKLGGLFLDTKRSPGVLPPGVTAISQPSPHDVLNRDATAMIPVLCYELTLDNVKFDLYDDLGSSSPTPDKATYPFSQLFVLEHLAPPLHEFAFAVVGTRQQALDRGFRTRACVTFRRTETLAPNQNAYDSRVWTIPYEGEDGNETKCDVFSRAGKPPIVELKEMPIHPFKRLNATGSEIIVIRPKVDMTPAYVQALKADKAY